MYQYLKYFFSSYFHQDWILEGKTLEDILDSFKCRESRNIIDSVIKELGDLNEMKYISEDFVYSLGCFMIPDKEIDGNILPWLQHINKYLSKY